MTQPGDLDADGKTAKALRHINKVYDLGRGVHFEIAQAADTIDTLIARVRAAEAKVEELREAAEKLVGQSDEPWISGNDTDRLHYWRDKAINVSKEILVAIDGDGAHSAN